VRTDSSFQVIHVEYLSYDNHKILVHFKTDSDGKDDWQNVHAVGQHSLSDNKRHFVTWEKLGAESVSIL